MSHEKTIAAISTPIGTGGIGVIKISGKNSLKIIKKILKNDSLVLKPRQMKLVNIKTKNFEDKSLVVYFKAPKSYTGEDVVEIHTHGGIFIQEGVLNMVLEKGAELAEPGEFTKRAFLNGKISLDAAEGVIDMINAESQSEVKAGSKLLKGNLLESVKSIQSKLTDIIAETEAVLDYPEDEIQNSKKETFKKIILENLKEVEKIYKTSETGKYLKKGIDVAIVGRPNSGKSSLMNALVERERSIVTEIEGTTRDTIEDSYIYKGVKINIIDKAGIRESKNKIERIGIERTRNTIEQADIVLFVLDKTKQINKEEKDILNLLKNKKHILVLNKKDKNKQNFFSKEDQTQKKLIETSALFKEGINEVKENIYKTFIDNNVLQNKVLITNQRHIKTLKKVKKALKDSLKSIEESKPMDLVVIDIKDAWEKLGEITGETSSEEIINRIFEKFCLGK